MAASGSGNASLDEAEIVLGTDSALAVATAIALPSANTTAVTATVSSSLSAASAFISPISDEEKRKNHPFLVFCEQHSDPFIGRVFKRLLPRLNELEYKYFFDESREKELKGQLAFYNAQVHRHGPLAQECKRLNLDISKRSDRKAVLSQSSHLARQYISLDENGEFDLDCYPATLANQEFLVELEEKDFIYKGIDPHCSSPMSQHGMAFRDEIMANEYLTIDQSAFGRIGMMHAEGIQQQILSKIPREIALDSFCFFYIYSKPLTKELALPLGMICIDATEGRLSEDQVVELILAEIKRKVSRTINLPLVAGAIRDVKADTAIATVDLRFRTPRGIISIAVEDSLTIRQVKEKIFQQEGFPIEEQRFIAAGLQLEDHQLVSHYETTKAISKLDYILLTVRPTRKPQEVIGELQVKSDAPSTSNDNNSSATWLKILFAVGGVGGGIYLLTVGTIASIVFGAICTIGGVGLFVDSKMQQRNSDCSSSCQQRPAIS